MPKTMALITSVRSFCIIRVILYSDSPCFFKSDVKVIVDVNLMMKWASISFKMYGVIFNSDSVISYGRVAAVVIYRLLVMIVYIGQHFRIKKGG
jgi:hypothetical protein